MKKRILSCILTFILSLTLILGQLVLTTPVKTKASGDGVQVFRNDWETEWGDEFDSLEDAWESIPIWYQGEQMVYIRLESNQGITKDLSTENFRSNVYIDLNGYVLYSEMDDEPARILVCNSSDYTFNICDRSAGGEDKYFEKKTRQGWEWDEHGSGGFSCRGGVIHDINILVGYGVTCTIRNTTFIGRDTGVTCNDGGYINLYNDRFYGCAPSELNDNTFGGAVTVCTDDGHEDNRVHAVIQGCIFQYNYSPFAGGAIYAGCSIALKSTTIKNNSSYYRGGGVFAGRSFGIVYNSDGESYDRGGSYDVENDIDTYRASTNPQKGDEVVYNYDNSQTTPNTEDDIMASTGAGFGSEISTDDLAGVEADEVMIIIFERVIITDNYDYQYKDASGALEPSNIYLRCQEEYCQDLSFSRRFVSAIKIWQGTEPTFIRIGVRKSGSNNSITVDHPDHGSYLDGEEKCIFADAAADKNWAGYQEAFIEYVPEDGHSYKILYDPIFIDSNEARGYHYDSIEEAIYYYARGLKALKSVTLNYESMKDFDMTLDLNGSNITLINGLATEANSKTIKIKNTNPKDEIIYVLDNDKDGIYETISTSGKPSDNTIPYVKVYGQAFVGANDKCGIVSGTESSTDICYYKGIYSFTSPFNDYCANNEYTDLDNVNQDVYICDGKQQFTINLPTSILSYNGNKVYHFGNVSNSSSNSFTLGELAEDGSITVTSSTPWTGRQSFTVEVVSDVVNFESYTLTVYVNSAHEFLASGENDTSKSECTYCGKKNIEYTGITASINNPTYDGTDGKTPEVVLEDGDTKLKEGTHYTVTQTPQSEIGATDYKLTITGIGNYIGTRTENWNLSKGVPKATDFTYTAPDNLTYDKSGKTATVTVKSGVNGMGTIDQLYYKSTKDGATMTTTAPTNVGTYKVYIDANEGQNYNATTNPIEVGQFTITVATPVEGTDYMVPTDLEANCGDKLSTVTLPSGFEWTSSDDALSADNIAIPSKVTRLAKYVPTDTNNYSEVQNIAVEITLSHIDDNSDYLCDACGEHVIITSDYVESASLALDGTLNVTIKLRSVENNDLTGWTINKESISNATNNYATIEVAPKDYNEKIEIEFKGVLVKSFTVADLLDRYEEDANTKAIAESLEAYCSAAEAYFGEQPVADYSTYWENVSNATGGHTVTMKEKYYGSSLVLESGTILRHYYTEDFVGSTGSKYGYYYVDQMIPAHLYAKESVSEGTYCVNDYIYRALNNPSSTDNLKNLCVALYNYGKAAEQYRSASE